MTPSPRGIVRGTRNTGEKIRVLVVDDSVVIRHLVREILQSDPAIEVVGAEANGRTALARIPSARPDVVTLDIEMPEMDGLEALRRIRKEYPHLRVVMCSSLTSRGASATFEALALGADDYVTKPASIGSLEQSVESLRADLLPKIKQFFTAIIIPARVPLAPIRPATVPGAAPLRRSKIQVIAIGVSTGGPQALAKVIPHLPAKLPVPVLVVQHMPAMFTRLLAERLHASSAIPIAEAAEGMPVQPGRMILAQGGYHLKVRRAGPSIVASLDQGPPENSCRPAVDVLFRSVADVYGGNVLSIVLTGMGADGLRGTEVLKQAGGFSIVQDEASSIVWGMPGAVAHAGLADRVLPLDNIVPEIVKLLGM